MSQSKDVMTAMMQGAAEVDKLRTHVDQLQSDVATLDQESRQMRARMERLERERDQLLVALKSYEMAFDGLFAHCLSNGVFNAWQAPLDCTALNLAHEAAGAAIAAVDQPASAPSAVADGWIEWNGGESPVHGDTVVDVRFECGDQSSGIVASFWDWSRGDVTGYDIIAYRVVEGGSA